MRSALGGQQDGARRPRAPTADGCWRDVMRTPEPDHDLLLDYLYDALEADERARVEEHLRTSAAWREALESVRGQRRLLAAAARMSFPTVTFGPPATVPMDRGARDGGRDNPRPGRAVRRRRLWPWVAAAAVLLALAGGSIPGVSWWRDYAEAGRTVARARAEIAG